MSSFYVLIDEGRKFGIFINNSESITDMKKIASFLVFLFVSVQLCLAQKMTLSGIVFSADDSYPLPGVAVLVKGVSSDMDGKYSIDVEKGDVVVFRSFGFADKEVTVNQSAVLNVYLENDALVLDEVVAVGYGVMKKSDLTGAVASVKGEQL